MTSELPDVTTQFCAKSYTKVIISDFFGEEMTSGNSEVTSLMMIDAPFKDIFGNHLLHSQYPKNWVKVHMAYH